MAVDFPRMEKLVLRRWKDRDVFGKTLRNRARSPHFVFYEGPPTANGSPGMHHVFGRSYKDVVCRYKTMRGFFVRRRAGWDTHGLPVELQVEKELGLNSKRDIEKYGIARFNKKCKQSVWRYQKEWEEMTERVGFWMDMEDSYITYKTEYMESLWWVIKQFANKGLLYKDRKVVPYCPRCGTALSFHEVAQGYETVKDPAVTVKFRVSDGPLKGAFLLAWTTTPWTLPSNVALAVNPGLEYVVAKKEGETYAAAAARSEILGSFTLIKKLKGKELVGTKYEPLYRFGEPEKGKKAWEVVSADFVSSEEGTGVVHTAVAHGADDFELGRKENLAMIELVSERGEFTKEAGPFAGMYVKDADPEIISDLKGRGLLFAKETVEHEYPHCWRCSTPLLYSARVSWFVNTQKDKKNLISNNRKVNWIPPHIKEGRMGEWLADVRDWGFSRERYWGTPLPVWECVCGERKVIGSRKELLSAQKANNTYYVMRHGHSEKQKLGIVSSYPETKPMPLTPKGNRQAKKAAKELKNKGVDLILTSDLVRCRQTADVVAKELGVKVNKEPALRESGQGVFNGRPITDVWEYWEREGESEEQAFERKFRQAVPGGETYAKIKKRMYGLVERLEKRYEGRTILLVSHELPITLLEAAVSAKTREETRKYRTARAIAPGEWRRLSFAKVPFDETMELDLHRPFVDEVKLRCSCGREMRRVPDIADVWFDSGAMPFAQWHYPFEQKRLVDGGEQFPADYIVEGVDQTRGWFYTLLAVSTLLGRGAPFRSAISTGHLLDEKGQKMSKSKGNVVDPAEMMETYGSDALRWYFYTASGPGESKTFSQNDLQLASRKFLLPLSNSAAFFELYGAPRGRAASTNALDRWILSRLASVTSGVTSRMDEYDVTGAARQLESFVTEDLSLWYVRRSRPRFQNPRSRHEIREASNTLRDVLLQTVLLAAPFTPFLAEELYAKLNGKKESCHLEDWPKGQKRNVKLEREMRRARELAGLGLAERAKAGIRVRQPLSGAVFGGPALARELAGLVADELNVKKVSFAPKAASPASLDTAITQELREEGTVRELVRIVQDMRKRAGYTPRDRVLLRFSAPEGLADVILRNKKEVGKAAGVTEFLQGARPKRSFDEEAETTLRGEKLWLGMRKV